MTTKFSRDVVHKLLHGLAHDDEFRAAFQKDPRAALSSIGHDTPAEHVGVEGKDPVMSFMTLKGGLASKEKIAASKDSMASEYNNPAPGATSMIFNPFTICAG